MQHSNKRTFLLQLLFLALAVIALYGNFLASPLVFDDLPFFKNLHPESVQAVFSLDLRWLPYASFGWTRALLGEDVVWLRLGNLALHIANVLLLFLFLRRLFGAALSDESTGSTVSANGALAPAWLAFFGALLFALHPVAVYGVAYLVQRTILMATMFALITWLLFLEGLIRGQQRWLLVSALTYLLAVLAKEHALMVPAVSAALLMLLRKPGLFVRAWPTFLLYAGVGAFIVFKLKASAILGSAYEPNAVTMLSELGITPHLAYPLSVLTQSFLYFKYLWLWLAPNPAWVSVDMLENFATRLWSWPELAGLVGFVGYPVIAIRLLWQRGNKGLLGFALLCPWLLFATELSTVRIQEVFVLYRSYLWMPCLFAALPFLLQKLPAKHTVALLTAITLAMIPASWNRLSVFTDPVLLWDDALQLTQKQKHKNYFGMGRIYHNRGVAYSDQKLYPQAIQDFDEALRFRPQESYIYNDRAVAYLKTKKYAQALFNYDMAIRLDPGYYNPYLGRAQVYEALGNAQAAQQDYAQSCKLGVEDVCIKNIGD